MSNQGQLKDQFASVAPRDNSGPRSANRYDFQDDWALCKLVELHESGRDYVLIFDFFDDIVELNSASHPTSIVFYQVKTKSTGFWSRADITRTKRGKDGTLPSILGKLYANYEMFRDYASGLYFVSNAFSSIKLASGGDAKGELHFQYAHICPIEKSKIVSSLTGELGTAPEEAGLKLFVYSVCELSIQGHADNSLGRLTRFLGGLGQGGTTGAPAFYRTLKSEIGRRAKSESVPKVFKEVCKHRGIDRESFAKMIHHATMVVEPPDVVRLLRERLNSEGVSYGVVATTCSAARNITVRRLDPINRQLSEAEKIVRDAVGHRDVFTIQSLDTEIQAVAQEIETTLHSNDIFFESHYLMGLIGVVIVEEQELQGVDPNVEDEEA